MMAGGRKKKMSCERLLNKPIYLPDSAVLLSITKLNSVSRESNWLLCNYTNKKQDLVQSQHQ